jgi:hypothetical protein
MVAEATKRRDALMKDYRDLTSKRIGPKRPKDKAELKKVSEQLKVLQKELGEVQKVIPPEHEMHGWVWLFERATIESRGKR